MKVHKKIETYPVVLQVLHCLISFKSGEFALVMEQQHKPKKGSPEEKDFPPPP